MATVPFSKAASEIQDADMLLYRNGSAVSWLIRLWTLSRYSHVATAYRTRVLAFGNGAGPVVQAQRLGIVDTMEGTGGRGGPEGPVWLFDEVRKYPGVIDWFQVDTERFPEYDRRTAVEWALANLPGRPYGRITIWHMLRVRLPFLRLHYRPDWNDLSATGGNFVCSTARAEMDCVAGKDGVPGLANAFVTPGHLSMSLLFKPPVTLMPDD